VLLLVLLLLGTNLLTLALLLWWRLRPVDHPAPDPVVAATVNAMRPVVSTSSTRRIITIEILNPIELAGTRGRLAGLAGSLAPGITRRIVYDQAMKNLHRQLIEEQVVADVRLHTVSPARADGARGGAPMVDVVEVEPGAEQPEQSAERASEG
jgi:hypothetical protein